MKEVYVCYFDNSVIYVGSGNHGRHKHCISGCSHVYELNKIHFSKDCDRVTVKVIATSLDKTESLNLEKDLILQYRPRLNKVYLQSGNSMITDKKKIMNAFSLALNKHNYKFGDKMYSKYMDTVSKFITQYKLNSLRSGITVSIKELGSYEDLKCFSGRIKYRDSSPYLYSIFDISNVDGIYNIKLKDSVFRASTVDLEECYSQ